MNKTKKLHVRTGDTVVVISGVDAGKKGKVLRAEPKAGKVVVEGVAMVTKHQKARGQGMPGGIIHKEAAIYASKVMLVCSKCGKATRNAHKVLEDGKKVRVCKKCGAAFEN
ncbi:MAG: 50S ribosomal protein L24 [Christensenellales bacterium]|jgi:large subunit ribosomal protein L24|uniref:Large ribosomal subunit protein uL24 n=1 Tax=Candidatus Avichristensenella intestinipullorum TaxID=2840693 RepID=A0A9D0YUQ9_9FIRM|nr:50S ribosomal protein L24 [Christensenellales bacterium]HIQ62429.1 50S ribosomal protein L24 [Candidatus Avichristensenella intestinipullorum]